MMIKTRDTEFLHALLYTVIKNIESIIVCAINFSTATYKQCSAQYLQKKQTDLTPTPSLTK